jgi:hypothetical protein
VISPLLANIYLNVLDKTWKLKRIEERFGARLIRYADDCVVLCRGNSARILKGLKAVLEYLELNLNEEKTKVLNARVGRFNFLSFTIRLMRSGRTGGEFPLIRPSKLAIQHLKTEIRNWTNRKSFTLPEEVVIENLNERVRGWTEYFRYGHCSEDLAAVKWFLEERVKRYLRRKHRKKRRSHKIFSFNYMYGKLGLYKIPITSPWTQTVKASGGG